MEKFTPHKSCSCSACKSGKTKKATKVVEKSFRRNGKIKLKRDQEEFENTPNPSGYFD
jgi:hypothetical protein